MSESPFPDADARREQRELNRREELRQEDVDLQMLMSEAYGRRVVHRLLEQAGVFQLSYVKGDPHETSFNEGRRNIGNWLLAQLMTVTPDQYAQMLKEHSDAR